MKNIIWNMLGVLVLIILLGIYYIKYNDFTRINCPVLIQNKDDMTVLLGDAYEIALESEKSRKLSISMVNGMIDLLDIPNMFEDINKCPSIPAVRMIIFGFIGNGFYFTKDGKVTLDKSGSINILKELSDIPQKTKSKIKNTFANIESYIEYDNKNSKDLVNKIYIYLVRTDYTKNGNINITEKYIKKIIDKPPRLHK